MPSHSNTEPRADSKEPSPPSHRAWAALAQAWIALAILTFFYLRVLESHTGQRFIGVIRARLGI
jgi:hypothetical protein